MFRTDELLKATGGKLVLKGNVDSFPAVSIDSRAISKGCVFIAIKGNNFDGHDFIPEALKNGASCVICNLSYGVCDKIAVRGATYIHVKDTVSALGDIAYFHRKRFSMPVIALTGSNGKTTTKEMISKVLSVGLSVLKNEGTQNNHIGVPMSLLNLNKGHRLAVLELGTNHPGEIAYLAKMCCADIGVITNVGPSHLEFLVDLQGVLEEKHSLVSSLDNPSIAVFNGDDVLLKRRLSSPRKGQLRVSFGMDKACDYRCNSVRLKNNSIEFKVGKNAYVLNSVARHNVYNALAAISLGRIFGVSHNKIRKALADFNFPKGRLNMVKLNNLILLDDTYNSNPLSLRSAIDTLAEFKSKGRKILVIGDMLELGDGAQEEFHSKAGEHASKVCDVIITVGRLSRLAALAAQRCGFSEKNIFTCDSSDEAREVFVNKIGSDSDDVVLVKGSRAMKMERVFKG